MIITLPLGCLKAADVKFQPALPEWKTDAIAKLGNGNLNKVQLNVECRRTLRSYQSVSGSPEISLARIESMT